MMTSTGDIQLFRILKQKMGERDAETLVSLMDNRFKEISNANLSKLATKEDIRRLEVTTKEDIGRLEVATKEDMGRLEIKIGDTKAETLRWVFGLFMITMLAILGLYFK